MSKTRPTFVVQFLEDGSGYVIEFVWPDGRTEQVEKLFSAPRFAQEWVIENSESWIATRLV